jgi:threonine dehydrogenase-like Zn-dependent dehydrogenase
MKGYGTTVHGGFAEYCVVPTSQVYQIPDTMTFAQAAMAEPVACCVHGIDMCDIHPGDTVVVFGAGMIGLIMLQLARLSGAAYLVSVEPIEAKRALAKQMGADLTIDPYTEDVAETLRKHGLSRIHTVIECVGRTQTIQQAIEIAGPKAVVMMFGLTKPEDTISVKPFDLFKREVVLKASYINPYTQKRAISLISSGKLDVNSMIYDTIPLDELPGLLADTKKRGIGKYIVEPGK